MRARVAESRRSWRVAGAVLSALFLASGCGVALRAGRSSTRHDGFEVSERSADRCIHGMTGPDSPYRTALPGPITDPALLAAIDSVPAVVRRTAVAAGIEPLLARVLDARGRAGSDPAAQAELLELRDELSARVYALETQLLAMEFEVDCVRALINARLGEYEESETDRQLALTIASLVVGAGTGLGAGIWDLANSETESPAVPAGPLVVGIVGAATTTALGVAVLLPEPRAIVYEHAHDVLTPIVSGDDPERVFPTFVFRLMTLPTVDGEPTPREELAASFTEHVADVVPEDQRALAADILFGEGGVYDVRLLQLHQDLLEDLGGTLDGLARDIDRLASVMAVLLASEDTLGTATSDE